MYSALLGTSAALTAAQANRGTRVDQVLSHS